MFVRFLGAVAANGLADNLPGDFVLLESTDPLAELGYPWGCGCHWEQDKQDKQLHQQAGGAAHIGPLAL